MGFNSGFKGLNHGEVCTKEKSSDSTKDALRFLFYKFVSK